MNTGAATVTQQEDNNGATEGILVNGTMTATGTNFPGGPYDNSRIEVGANGSLTASNSTFAWNYFELDNGSKVATGNLTGNIFNTTVYAPATDVQYLGNNASFQAIDLLAGSLSSGQSVSLGLIGTVSHANLKYLFTGAFEVQSGATLSFANGASVQINNGQTITVDAGGTLNTGAATVTQQEDNNGATEGILVNGTMTATGTDFPGGPYDNSRIEVGANGSLTASNSTFAWNYFELDNGSKVATGNLTGNIFNTTVYAPATDVQYLGNNASFQAIDLLAGSLSSGQSVSLGLIGTVSHANLKYLFTGAFEVQSGATLSFANGASVQINNGQTITVDAGGTLNTGAATVTQQEDNNGATEGILVNGTMTATGTNFPGGPYDNSRIEVGANGSLTASNSTFAWNYFELDNGSKVATGNLTGNIFNTTVYAPATDVQYLGNNASFQAIDLLAGSLSSGQSVSLALIGTASHASLQYVFTGAFEVKSGATLSVGTGASVQINNGQTITVDAGGALTVVAATVTQQEDNNGATEGILVNGTMTATGAKFPGGPYDNSRIQVNTGGQLVASNNTFGWNDVTLNAGTSGQVAADIFNTQLTINSGTTVSVTGSSFANGTVVASGDSTATINLTNNYWGTTTTAQIEAKITDHHVNSNLPTVSFTPFLSAATPPGAVTTIVASSTAATFNANASQSVTLSASLTSGSVKPGAGTVTFILVNGTSMIGNPVTANVSSGSASTTILLPAGTLGGTDTILAIYNGTASYLGSMDASHTVTVNPATATTTASNASDTFSAVGTQTVDLSATVTSPNGTVNEGTETFTVLNGSTPVGSSVTVNVVNGAAGATYTVPAGTRAGTYTIEALYNGTVDFKPATDTAHVLTVGAAATTTSTVNTSTTYSASSRTVPLSATVTSSAGTVNEGTETFTVLNGSTPIGPAIGVAVSNGAASTPYTLPAGLLGGKYTIKAVYDGGPDFNTSADITHTLTVNPAATTTAAANVTTTFSTSAHPVLLTATVTSPAGTVGEGSETFTVLNGTIVIGMATTGNLAGGAVSVNYTIPANEPVGTYTIKAVYNGTADFLTAIDMAHVLTIAAVGTAITTGITGTTPVSTGGGIEAPVTQVSQATSVESNNAGVSTSSSGHKVHQSSIKMNRGPLSINRHTTTKHLPSGQKLPVADRPSHTDARPRHRG